MVDGRVRVDLRRSFISDAQKRWLPKDQYKSDAADVLVMSPGSVGASGEYGRLWREAGRSVSPGVYTGREVVFVTTNGLRRRRVGAHVDEIRRAAAAGCVFLTDGRRRRPEGGNMYNVGEQEVADLLRSLGYAEREELGGLVARWTGRGDCR